MIVCLEEGVAKCKFSAGVEKAITDKREEDRSRHLTVQAFFSCGLLQEYVTDLGHMMERLEETEVTHVAMYLFCCRVCLHFSLPGPP